MSQYTDDYLEARTETGVSEGFLRGSRRLEKRWELTDGSLPASKVLSSGIDGFNSVSEFLGARKKETFLFLILCIHLFCNFVSKVFFSFFHTFANFVSYER